MGFEATLAVRSRVQILLGLVGPSGGGKTYSALRLATGIQQVAGGKIYYVDTENRRATHYADEFQFMHVPFGAPFGPLRYLEALEYCAKEGASVVVVDSTSHEWEGPGGILEQHDTEAERLAKSWGQPRSVVQFPAWAEPKKRHTRLIQSVLHLPCHFIFCFRAKQKTKTKDKKLVQLGWQPITGGDFIYEFNANMLLPPCANGVPEWNPENPAERLMVKRPKWAADILTPKRQLSEDVGRELAQWAEGTTLRTFAEVLADMESVADDAVFGALRREARLIWGGMPKGDRDVMLAAMEAAKCRLAAPAAENEPKAIPEPESDSGSQKVSTSQTESDGEMSAEEEERMEREMAGASDG